MKISDSIRLAVGTLTIIPVPPPRVINSRTAGGAMAIAPLAGLPIFAVTIGVGLGLRDLHTPTLLIGFIMVAILQFLTRAMHADGLADTIDGFGASWDRERALAVMKSGDVGPMGVLAMVLALICQGICFGELITSTSGSCLIGLSLIGSRAALGFGCIRGVPAARQGGLGATVAGSLSLFVVVGWQVVLLVAYGLVMIPAIVVWPVAGLVTVAVLVAAVKRFGGITGDVLGALVEISLTISLITSVVLVSMS